MNHTAMPAALLAPLFLAVLSGCVPPPPEPLDQRSNLTQGQVQLHLEVGKTTKAEVVEIFGAPNIVTRDGSGQEVWTYQRSAQASQSSSRSGYWTVILGGQSGENTGFESSSRMLTLIIKFNNQDIVSDFSSRTSNF